MPTTQIQWSHTHCPSIKVQTITKYTACNDRAWLLSWNKGVVNNLTHLLFFCSFINWIERSLWATGLENSIPQSQYYFVLFYFLSKRVIISFPFAFKIRTLCFISIFLPQSIYPIVILFFYFSLQSQTPCFL